uniref:Uncharacterized protein n=1 Tax=Ralstonia solanacearum CFBP2957 TaxID=859656 RepID=D8P665_RALSL|nr:protein of unknown function [Ralstonia solanacearum CFBP2957]
MGWRTTSTTCFRSCEATWNGSQAGTAAAPSSHPSCSPLVVGNLSRPSLSTPGVGSVHWVILRRALGEPMKMPTDQATILGWARFSLRDRSSSHRMCGM